MTPYVILFNGFTAGILAGAAITQIAVGSPGYAAVIGVIAAVNLLNGVANIWRLKAETYWVEQVTKIREQ